MNNILYPYFFKSIIEVCSVGCGCSYVNLTNAESLDCSFNSHAISLWHQLSARTWRSGVNLPRTKWICTRVNFPRAKLIHTCIKFACASPSLPPSPHLCSPPSPHISTVHYCCCLLLLSTATAFCCCLPLAVSACFHKVQSPLLPVLLLLSSHHCLSRAFTACSASLPLSM